MSCCVQKLIYLAGAPTGAVATGAGPWSSYGRKRSGPLWRGTRLCVYVCVMAIRLGHCVSSGRERRPDHGARGIQLQFSVGRTNNIKGSNFHKRMSHLSLCDNVLLLIADLGVLKKLCGM